MENIEIHFKNRFEAGQLLSKELTHLKVDNPYVVALPRGGVLVASPIAKEMGRPIDLLLVKKISAPGHPELAIGAIAEDGDPVWQESKISYLNIPKLELNRLVVKAQQALHSLRRLWKTESRVTDFKDQTVILVDDGMTSASTLAAGISFLRKRSPRKIVVAVPIASRSTLQKISEIVDEVICPNPLGGLESVGQIYSDFAEVPDRLITEIIEKQGPTSLGIQFEVEDRKKSGAEQFHPQPEIEYN